MEVKINNKVVSDIRNITNGAFAPLKGFMNENDFYSVINNYKLSDESVWTLPIFLSLSKKIASKNKLGDKIFLVNGSFRASLNIEDIFIPDKLDLVKSIYGTNDINHPGVNGFINSEECFIGGSLEILTDNLPKFPDYEISPSITKEIIKNLGWKKIVGFHTRNPPHRAHEYLQRCALETSDGLFIQPVIGEKKDGDFCSKQIIDSYEWLVDNIYNKNRVILSALDTYSRYAGPREAVFTAQVRKNFGCTHFIVGRDHTGVGNYYGKYDSHNIFKKIGDIGIDLLYFDGPFYCQKCETITTERVCGHLEDRVEISGTYIRDCLSKGLTPSSHIIRPEIFGILKNNK